MPRPSLLVAATLIASPWACAQAPYLIGYDPQDPNHAPAQDTLISPSPRAWPDFLETAIHAGQSTPTSTFQRAIAGNFTGHAVADVVTLNDSIPVLITAPGLHDHCGRLLFSDPGHVVRDIAAVIAEWMSESVPATTRASRITSR